MVDEATLLMTNETAMRWPSSVHFSATCSAGGGPSVRPNSMVAATGVTAVERSVAPVRPSGTHSCPPASRATTPVRYGAKTAPSGPSIRRITPSRVSSSTP